MPPGTHRTAQALYDAVVARNSSPATAALGRLLLPHLFPELSAFAMVEDLVSHLRASDDRYRATVPAKFLHRNPPPMFITLYFIVTRLPDSLCSVKDHFLSLDPTSLTIDLLKEHLLAADTSAVAVGAARGTPRTPFFEGCSPSPLAPSYFYAAAADVPRVVEGAAGVVVGAAVEVVEVVEVVAVVGLVVGVGALVAAVEAAVGVAAVAVVGMVAVGLELGVEVPEVASASSSSVGARPSRPSSFCPRWADLLRSGVAIFDLDFDVILSALYALSVSAEGDCYRCVPPDPGIAAAALGARESGTLLGTIEALHTFTLDSGASRCIFRDSTTLTPLPAPFPVRLADPSGGPVVACSSTVLPRPAIPFGSLSGLHLPSFSTNLPPQVAASALVSASGQVAPPCSCRLLSHQTLLWHHCLGHPSLPRLHGMHSRLLVSGLPRSLPPLPPSPAPPCLPCVKGRQRTAPHSSSSPPTTAPLQTLHMDVLGTAHVVDVLIPWIRAVRLQVRERFRADLPVLRLHSNRGGEFSSNLLREFCHGEGILQSFTLPQSPQQNGIAERRIGLVMEVAHTSMIHAAAPHFLWSFAARYAAHQLNLWPRVSLAETSPTLCWTGKVGDASVFRVWGSRAFVRDTSADKLSARAIPCVFLGFVPDVTSWQFYHPTLHRVLPSQDLTAPLVDPLPPQGPAPSGVHQVDPPPSAVPGEVAVDSGAASGTTSRGAEPGGTEPGDAETRGTETGVAETGGAETGGAETGGAEPKGVEPGGAELEGAESRGAEPQGAALSGGSAGASPTLSPQQLPGGAGVTTGAGVPRGTAATGPGGARTRGTGSAGTGGVGGAVAGDPTESGATSAVGSCAGGAGADEAGVGGTRAGGAGAGGAGAVDPGGTSQPSLQPASPLPAPSPYSEQTGGLTERREPASCPASPVCTDRRVPRPRPPLVPGTHAMRLRPSSVPLRVPLPDPPDSSLPAIPDPESDRSTAASAFVAELLDFAAACRLDYATALVAESESASPPSVGGECALGTDILEDRQEDFECLEAAVPRFASMLLASDRDLDAPDIPTPRSYSEAITGTYVDEVPPPGTNIVDGMWIFRVKRPSGSPPAFKARYVARGSHSFLQGSLHEEIWLRSPPGFTGSFLAGTQTTLAALGFAPATADPSLFLRTDTSLPPFYVLVYVNDLVFATADTEALTLVKSELQKRHTCTDLGELRSYLGLYITRDKARCTITLTLHMVHQVLQRFDFQFSSPQPTPLSTSHSLLAPPSDESVELSGPYPELVGCLMDLMTCTRPDLVYPLSLLARYVAPSRHRKVHWDAAKRVLRYLCSTSGMGLVLGGRGPVVLTGHADASWVDDSATQRSSQGYTFSLGSGSVSWKSTCSSSVLSSSCEAEIYAGAMAAQELRWLTYLLIDLGEQPRSPPQRGQLRLAYVATRANTADIFTKALPPSDHQRFSTVLGLVPSLPHLLST
ncbi:unnamed protein product [Closterium sp. NIES-53]